MAKAAGGRMKVFQAQLGFYDTVVAAPSQAAALRAWGVHQNLFADGQAKITDDPQAVAAALAHPETPLKRAVGSTDAFALEAASLPKTPDAPKPAAKIPPAPPPPKPAADRSALSAAEAALHKLDEDRKRVEAELRRRQEALDAERDAAQAAYVEGRKAATAALVAARAGYRRAGGRTDRRSDRPAFVDVPPCSRASRDAALFALDPPCARRPRWRYQGAGRPHA